MCKQWYDYVCVPFDMVQIITGVYKCTTLLEIRIVDCYYIVASTCKIFYCYFVVRMYPAKLHLDDFGF